MPVQRKVSTRSVQFTEKLEEVEDGEEEEVGENGGSIVIERTDLSSNPVTSPVLQQ